MKYAFLGYVVGQDNIVEIPDDCIVVGGNFIGSTWQIMCLVPVVETAPPPENTEPDEPESGEDEEEDEKEEPNAEVSPKS